MDDKKITSLTVDNTIAKNANKVVTTTTNKQYVSMRLDKNKIYFNSNEPNIVSNISDVDLKNLLRSKKDSWKIFNEQNDEYTKSYSKKILKFSNKLYKSLTINDGFKYYTIDNNNGTYEIKGYKPTYLADKNKGITLPLNMMGVNEDKLLENVSVVRGDLILDNKDVLLNSHITKIPEKLEKVTGKISCNRAQYEQFGDRLQQIAQNPKAITVHE